MRSHTHSEFDWTAKAGFRSKVFNGLPLSSLIDFRRCFRGRGFLDLCNRRRSRRQCYVPSHRRCKLHLRIQRSASNNHSCFGCAASGVFLSTGQPRRASLNEASEDRDQRRWSLGTTGGEGGAGGKQGRDTNKLFSDGRWRCCRRRGPRYKTLRPVPMRALSRSSPCPSPCRRVTARSAAEIRRQSHHRHR